MSFKKSNFRAVSLKIWFPETVISVNQHIHIFCDLGFIKSGTSERKKVFNINCKIKTVV